MDIKQDFIQVNGVDGAWEKPCGPPQALDHQVRKLTWAALHSQAALEEPQQGTKKSSSDQIFPTLSS